MPNQVIICLRPFTNANTYRLKTYAIPNKLTAIKLWATIEPTRVNESASPSR